MMIMMVKTIVLSLVALASVVTAIEDNVMEFGRFRVLKETSRSGWMQNKKITRRDQAPLQTTKQSVDDLDLDNFPWIDMTMSMSMSMKVPSTSPSKVPVVSPSPTAAPTTMVPTGSPSVSPDPTRSSQPSAAPSASSAPTGSTSPSAAPSISSAPTGSTSPSAAPSISSAPTGSTFPSAAPSISSGPSMSLSAAPSTSDQPSAVPSTSSAPTISPFPTSPPTPAPSGPPTSPPTPAPSGRPTGGSTLTFFREAVAFTCTSNGVDLIDPSIETATAIDIQVVYIVKTFEFLNDYEDDLQDKILASAVIGALQCNTGGPLFGLGGSVPTINMVTMLTGEACPPDLGSVLVPDIAYCKVFETSFQIIVEEVFDPAVAALLAYTFIREEMSSGAFVEAIPLLDSVEYLRPVLPEVLPIETPEIPNIDLAAQGSTVSNWTVGAALVAMFFGGATAIWVWTHNKSTGHRHVPLLEDESLTLPSALREATTP